MCCKKDNCEKSKLDIRKSESDICLSYFNLNYFFHAKHNYFIIKIQKKLNYHSAFKFIFVIENS